jgi:predicted amidophosphoribosyltransferase
MKYCPVCNAEYRDTIDVCSDCNERLISRGEFERRQAQDEQFQRDRKTLVKIFTLSNKFEADLITRELEKEGITVMIRNFRDTAYNGIYIPQKGWGEVRVPEKDRQRAMELIAALEDAFEAGKVSLADNENVVTCPFCGVELPEESRTCPACKKTLSDDA